MFKHIFLFLVIFVALVFGDCYMHNPRGSNNRLNERSANANNQNRLFDSQNNAAGGYCWGPPMHFFQGSLLSVEWTNQHSCGLENNACEVILQFMCADSVRDGNVTTTIEDNADRFDLLVQDTNIKKYGMHEDYLYYQACKQRERNKGLFIADRNVNNNIGARGTRQNNNGNRRGFECPEERDYYPYWHPNPWIDIAILTNDVSRCGFYQSESHNVKAKNFCNDTSVNNQIACKDGWQEAPPHNSLPGQGCIGAPECIASPWNRDNHLGNGIGGHANMYNWTIPSCIVSENCVLRIRYNISTTDYDGWNTFSSRNGKKLSPVTQNPYVNPMECDENTNCNLTLAINTSQFGRTFQDRSHTFAIRQRPSGIGKEARIFNLNVRGKRGNIVQAYPAVEYDFTPVALLCRPGDYIHIQWTGCDTNPGNFAGEGRAGTDRSNIVQAVNAGVNIPALYSQIPKSERIFDDYNDAFRAAFLDQQNCLNSTELQNQGNADQNPRNCGKLNAASPYIDLGLYKVSFQGKAHYFSSRNNNFSNRSQKGTIVSSPALKTFGVVIVAVGSAAFFVSMIFAGIAGFNAVNSNSPFASSKLFNAGN
jgi:hypothetical protein